MSYLEISRSEAITVYPKTVRLDIKLIKPDEASYNVVNYTKELNSKLGKDISSLDLPGLLTEDTFDRFNDYDEESYIDNTEVYRHTFPAGKEPELGGFYVNTGKLKLKSKLPESKSVDKNKKGEKKEISPKTKAIRTKTHRKKERTLQEAQMRKKERTLQEAETRKKERTLQEAETRKKENMMLKRKICSNTRLDALLKTVRKQKKNGTVKTIKMPNTSKCCSASTSSKNSKESSGIASKKKIVSAKKCSVASKEFLNIFSNSNKVTLPNEDFLSSKTNRPTLSQSSDSSSIEVLKEVIKSVNVGNIKHPFVKDNLTLATVTSELIKEGNSKEIYLPSSAKINSTSNTAISLNSTKPNFPNEMSLPCKLPILKSSPTSDATLPLRMPLLSTIADKETHLSSSKVIFEPDFATITPKNVSVPDFYNIGPNNTFESNFITSNPIVTNEPKICPVSPAIKKGKLLSSSKTHSLKKTNKSTRKINPDSALGNKNPVLNKVRHSKSSKTNVSKDSARKVTLNPPFYADKSPILKTMSCKSSSKTALPKKVVSPSRMLTTESTGCQKVPSTGSLKIQTGSHRNIPVIVSPTPSETIPYDKLCAYPSNTIGNLPVNSPKPETASKSMQISVPGTKVSTSCNISSVFPSNKETNVYDKRNLQSSRYEIETYSKESASRIRHQSRNKSLFELLAKKDSVPSSSVADPKAKRNSSVNATPPPSSTTAVNLYKMNISPIVRLKEPDNKF